MHLFSLFAEPNNHPDFFLYFCMTSRMLFHDVLVVSRIQSGAWLLCWYCYSSDRSHTELSLSGSNHYPKTQIYNTTMFAHVILIKPRKPRLPMVVENEYRLNHVDYGGADENKQHLRHFICWEYCPTNQPVLYQITVLWKSLLSPQPG